MTFKDLFSLQATDYARFRPVYPPELYAWLAAQAPARGLAVDVGTGNGQAAVALAAHFDRVIGVEPSDGQLANATPAARVEYRHGAAEATGVDAASADLLTVAQAFHWFKQDAFFAEVRRVVRPGGCLAFWCYGLAFITPDIDAAVHHYYEDLLGPYWEPERKLVEQGYRNVGVPFDEIGAPAVRDAAVVEPRSPARLSRHLVAAQALPRRARAGRARDRAAGPARRLGRRRRAPRQLAAVGARVQDLSDFGPGRRDDFSPLLAPTNRSHFTENDRSYQRRRVAPIDGR